jgi:hypothetical protein
MYLRIKLALAAVAFSTVAFAQNSPQDGPFQVKYAANLDQFDPVFNFTNTGVTVDPATGIGDICIHTYTFAYDEQLASCCSCKVTRNALWSLSGNRDLVSNILTPDPNIKRRGILVKLLSTLPVAGGCDAAHPGALTQGMAAWGTTFHQFVTGAIPPVPTGNWYGTETPFTNSTLSAGELNVMASFCGFIKANGSGFGICKSCAASSGFPVISGGQNQGLGADKQ